MKPKTKTILFIVAAFFLGLLSGIVVPREYSRYLFGGRSGPSTNIVKEFAERLHLNDRQTVQVDSILERRRQRLEVHRVAMLAVRDSVREEIRTLLDPEQKERFNAYVKEMNAREEHYRSSSRERR